MQRPNSCGDSRLACPERSRRGCQRSEATPVWNGHSCPLPLTLTLLLIRIATRPHAAPWKSGASAPREASKTNAGFQPPRCAAPPRFCHSERAEGARGTCCCMQRPNSCGDSRLARQRSEAKPVWNGHSCPLPLTLTLTLISNVRTNVERAPPPAALRRHCNRPQQNSTIPRSTVEERRFSAA